MDTILSNLLGSQSMCLGMIHNGELKNLSNSINTHSSPLYSCYKFENKYLYPEFRDLQRSSHFLLPGFSITYESIEYKVNVFLTIHKSGVGSIMFKPEDIKKSSRDKLKEISSFQRKNLAVSYSNKLSIEFNGSFPFRVCKSFLLLNRHVRI